MSDVEEASDQASQVASPKPADGNDPQDPLRPEVEEENGEEDPPLANPTLDMDATEDQADATENPLDGNEDDSDLSEIDEATFEDFDTEALDIEERPVAIDETNVNLIGTHKRKRTEGEDGAEKKKKKKRRDGKKSRRHRDADEVDGVARGDPDTGRARRRKDISEPSSKPRSRAKTPEDWSNLTEAERQKRELEKRMDEALRNPTARRRKVTGIDLEAANDELLDRMARRMTEAAESDSNEHKAGKPAMSKLRLLPEVMELLNRNTLQNSIVEPDSRLLEAVRFFLEPLEPDGALPAYNIQREMIGALARLPLDKDALSSSGIGRVILFYTKSKKPEVQIKRAAERLVGEWTRPILKRSNDYKKRAIAQAEYDPSTRPARPAPSSQQAQAAAARERKLAKPIVSNRAVVDRQLPSYTVAPRSHVVVQATGRSNADSFSRLKARQQLASRR